MEQQLKQGRGGIPGCRSRETLHRVYGLVATADRAAQTSVPPRGAEPAARPCNSRSVSRAINHSSSVGIT
jgi:hypothetical protein